MNKKISFTKMQGAGNDFVILDNRDGHIPPESYAALAKELCRRRISLGADGCMFVEQPRTGGDYAMMFYNSDGSIGEMCGNGARCIARYGYDRGLAGKIQRIETTAGLVTGKRIAEDRYQVRLNDPENHRPSVSIAADGNTYECVYWELGNPGIPHAIVRLEDWDQWPVETLCKLGRQLRFATEFPRGANVTFWKTVGKNHVKAITYERGVEDFTLACGTGAGCTAATLRAMGFANEEEIRLDFPGDVLSVSLQQTDGRIHDIYLTGPAVTVAEGSVYLP